VGKVLEVIDQELASWLKEQHVFFVATAPLAEDAHVNCSPKGGDCFRVLNEREVAYLDYTGSGAETIAHLRENGRIVLMFCAFDGKPNIVRLHGHGTVIRPGDTEYAAIITSFPPNAGSRSIIHVGVSRVSTSCGYAVPQMEFREERQILDRWAENKGFEKLEEYRAMNNSASIDGLPAL
jgi:hypothetical protein